MYDGWTKYLIENSDPIKPFGSTLKPTIAYNPFCAISLYATLPFYSKDNDFAISFAICGNDFILLLLFSLNAFYIRG